MQSPCSSNVTDEFLSAIIYCFNVRTPGMLKDEAKKQRVSIRHMNVIYHLVNDLKHEMSSKMPPVEEEHILGKFSMLIW